MDFKWVMARPLWLRLARRLLNAGIPNSKSKRNFQNVPWDDIGIGDFHGRTPEIDGKAAWGSNSVAQPS